MFAWSKRLRIKPFLAFLVGIVTAFVLWNAVPATAQLSTGDRPNKAPVVLDGRVLFHLADTEAVPAEQRAKIANTRLKEVLKPNRIGRSGQPRYVERENQATIEINGDRVLTVTAADIELLDRDPHEARLKVQARSWSKDLQRALQRARLERQATYQRQVLLISAIMLVVAIAIHFSLQWLRRRLPKLASRWLGTSTTPPYHWDQPLKLFVQLGLVGLQIGIWTAILWNVTDLFPLTRSWRYQFFTFLYTSIRSDIFTLGEESYSAWDVCILIVSALTLWFAVKAFTGLLKAYVLRTTGTERGLQETIAILTQYTLTFIGLFLILQAWGIDVSSLAIVASVLGVGIGFGLQNIVNDFVSGLIINLERPIQVGDFVNVGGLVGSVEQIGGRSTEIRTLDQVTIVVPNSRFLNSEVINWSHGNPVSRLHIPVGVAYGVDISQVRAALLEAARKHPDVLSNPSPQVWFQQFGDSSLNFDLLVWTSDPRNQFLLKSDLNYRIEASLRRYGIEIPFPQRDIHLRSPQLDDLISYWMQSQAPPEPQLHIPQSTRPSQNKVEPQEPPPKPAIKTAPIQFLEDINLDALVEEMRGPNGVKIQDRRYRLSVYPKCFVGSEAVAWMVCNKQLTRDSAVRLGQILVDKQIVHHVLDEQPFKDGFLFYRFYKDET